MKYPLCHSAASIRHTIYSMWPIINLHSSLSSAHSSHHAFFSLLWTGKAWFGKTNYNSLFSLVSTWGAKAWGSKLSLQSTSRSTETQSRGNGRDSKSQDAHFILNHWCITAFCNLPINQRFYLKYFVHVEKDLIIARIALCEHESIFSDGHSFHGLTVNIVRDLWLESRGGS